MRTLSFVRFPLVVLLLVAAPAAAVDVTFSRDVAPILNRHCVGCHRSGEIAPMSLATYREALRASGSVDGRGYFNVLAMWGAGTAPTEFREGAGRWIEPGAVVVMNQHYHPNGEEQTDRTLIGLHFGEGELRSEIQAVIAGEMDFLIPAGASDHRVEYRHEIARDSMIVSYLPHMHLRGKRMSYTAHYPDGDSELLLEVPDYDFNWQLFYYPEKPKLVPAGTVIEIVAVYDNSTSNPDNPDPSRDVGFGLQSTDEMMFGFFELVEVDGGS